MGCGVVVAVGRIIDGDVGSTHAAVAVGVLPTVGDDSALQAINRISTAARPNSISLWFTGNGLRVLRGDG